MAFVFGDPVSVGGGRGLRFAAAPCTQQWMATRPYAIAARMEPVAYLLRSWWALSAPESRAMLRRSTFEGAPPYARFGGLNGQSFRARVILNLLRTLPVDAFVETGTFHGYTAALVAAQTDLPVYTVEAKRRYFIAAQPWRLRFGRRLHLVHADSRAFLASSRLDGIVAPFVYLDAHWDDDLPLVREVELLATRFPSAVIVIDDFLVPGDDDYGYDEYCGAQLDLDLIRPALPSGARAFFPAVPAARETTFPALDAGMKKRGWVAIGWAPDVVRALESEPGLRAEPA